LSVDGNFPATHCLNACICVRILGFEVEFNGFRVIFPVIPVLRKFRAAGAGPGQPPLGGGARSDRDAASAFDHGVPVDDIAVERMHHDVPHPGLGIGGDARCSASAADVAVAQVAAARAVFEVVGL
jgi:hypothetical protein